MQVSGDPLTTSMLIETWPNLTVFYALHTEGFFPFFWGGGSLASLSLARSRTISTSKLLRMHFFPSMSFIFAPSPPPFFGLTALALVFMCMIF